MVLPNGDADPWHALSILERGDLDESVVPIVIKGILCNVHCKLKLFPLQELPTVLICMEKLSRIPLNWFKREKLSWITFRNGLVGFTPYSCDCVFLASNPSPTAESLSSTTEATAILETKTTGVTKANTQTSKGTSTGKRTVVWYF